MKYLNLGCGSRFHVDWENVDLVPASPSVREHNLRKGIPYGDAEFDVVYHSHVLEHFGKEEAARFLRECYRVLKPGGAIRVAVPDLERIVRLYLESLEKAIAGEAVWQQRYEWILLEMYDQTVREISGGEMVTYTRRAPIPEREFVESRLGGEFKRMTLAAPIPNRKRTRAVLERMKGWLERKAERLLLGRDGLGAYDVGRFRMSGEVHRWMYDRYSLGEILRKAGFENPRQLGASESGIESWAEYNLDTEPDGKIYKPDSLYMEAVRP